MGYVTWPQKALGFTIKNKLGLPTFFGWLGFGWSLFGDDNEFSGYYQGRYKRLNFFDGVNNKRGRKDNFVMRPYWPTQPPSAARDAQQNKFKTALLMWQSLTNEQKLWYGKNKPSKYRRGYDYFMSKTIKSL